jgi:hypothetical protein
MTGSHQPGDLRVARPGAAIIELEPEGRFLTYRIGVSLMDMRDPSLALARVPVE